MRYGIILTTGNLQEILTMAAEAEAAGWDGVFYWDGVAIPGADPIYDPWVTMAAIAMRTERVRFGAIVTPPTRRRPWKLARETATLDHLSHGRLVLPVGMGALDDVAFGGVGEVTDLRTRAAMLDESLQFLTRAWTGEPFTFEGDHYKTAEMTLRPPSVQQPRIPIWVVAVWRREKSVARALRYDGIIPQFGFGPEGPQRGKAADFRAMAELAREVRGPNAAPFEIIAEGASSGDNPEEALDQVQPLAEAGATWWIESRWMGETPETLRARINAGPPA